MSTDLLDTLDRIAQLQDGWLCDTGKAIDTQVLQRARALVQRVPDFGGGKILATAEGELILVVEQPSQHDQTAFVRATLVIDGSTVLISNLRTATDTWSENVSAVQDDFSEDQIVRFLTQGVLPGELDSASVSFHLPGISRVEESFKDPAVVRFLARRVLPTEVDQ